MKSLKKFNSLEEFSEAYSTPMTEEVVSFNCPLGTAVYVGNNGQYGWQIDNGEDEPIVLITFSRIPKIGVDTYESAMEKIGNDDAESILGAFDERYNPEENPEEFCVEITKLNITTEGQYKRPWTSLTKNGNITGMTATLQGGSSSEWTLVKKVRMRNVVKKGNDGK